VSTLVHDDADRLLSATDPELGTTSRTYDARGLVATVTDAEGRTIRSAYDERGLPVSQTLLDFVDPVAGGDPRDLVLETVAYDAVGRPVDRTDALGRTTRTTYDRADRVTEARLLDFDDGSGLRDIVLSATPSYDATGNPLVQLGGGGARRVVNSWDAAGRLVASTLELGDLDRTTTLDYFTGGQIRSIRRSDPRSSDLRTFTYDVAGRKVTETLGDGADALTTRYAYDPRGNVVAVTDPRGTVEGADAAAFTTEHGYDAAGRLVRTTSPAVAVDLLGGTARPETTVGWDAFGNEISRRDARGHVARSAFDGLDRLVRIEHPSYTPPGGAPLAPTEVFSYDSVGNLVARTDRAGRTTDFTFDDLNRVVRQVDPQVAGAAARGETTFAYDLVGNLLARTDPVGARTEWTYDDLDREIARTAVVRTGSAVDRFTTSTRYNDASQPIAVTDPTAATTQLRWSSVDELLEVIDPLGEITTYDRDHAGRLLRTTDPLGRASVTDYDEAGRPVVEQMLAPDGTVVARTEAAYDRAGNVVALTSPRGFEPGADRALFTTTHEVDALGRLTAVHEPASPGLVLTTRYGYDLAGNPTRLVDGRGNVTEQSWQPWDLPASTIEPSTPAHPALADRTFTTAYDSRGLPVREIRPGATTDRSFDELGRLLTETATAAGSPGASRAFTWDLAGRPLTASHPSGTVGLTWDDRGLLLSANGPAGAATFEYDAAGRMERRTDAAGAAAFTWTPRGELDTATDPVTGVERDLTWDEAGQLASTAYSTGNAESFTYDDLGRPATETLRSASGAVLAGHAYSYDANGNLTGQTSTLPGNAAAGSSTYAYDAADRLVSWTAPGGAVTPYEYDASGNRTRIGGQALTYDARNRQLTGPEGSMTWTARGTLATVTASGSVRTLTHDALDRLTGDRLVTDGLLGPLGGMLGLPPPLGPTTTSTAYAYDAFDRVAARNGAAFSYAGTELDPVVDPTSTYGRNPSGALVSSRLGAAGYLVGTDAHGDVSHLWQGADGGAVTGTRVYDPLGVPVASTGSNPAAGFQGDFTDPSSGRVWMGARWYTPRAGVFTARDTWSGMLQTPVSLNRYTYGFSNPRTWFDPDGHSPESDFWCGGYEIGPLFPGGGGDDASPGGLPDFLPDALTEGPIGDIVGAAADAIRQVASAAYQMGRSIVNTVVRAATNVARFAVDAANSIGDRIGSVARDLNLDGLVRGVGNAVGACLGNAFCSAVAQTIAFSALGAACPLCAVGAAVGLGVAGCDGDVGCMAASAAAAVIGGGAFAGAARMLGASRAAYVGAGFLSGVAEETSYQAFRGEGFDVERILASGAGGAVGGGIGGAVGGRSRDKPPVWEEMDAYRQRKGMRGEPGASGSDTLARVDIDGRSYHGTNSSFSPQWNDWRARQFADVRDRLGGRPLNPRANEARWPFHAEFNAVARAREANGGELPPIVELYVDKKPCSNCRGGLRLIVEAYDLDELVVHVRGHDEPLRFPRR
jgi:RHS repeat-associated protein